MLKQVENSKEIPDAEMNKRVELKDLDYTAEKIKLTKDAGVEVERREVSLPEAIRNIGEYEVTFQLHSDVAQTIQLVIEAE